MTQTTVINLFGGPGIGKSTICAQMYADLKKRGVSCEMVREYVKDWAWEQRQLGPYDQLHITGEQIRREALLLGRTNIVITDSPVLIGAEYARRYSPKHVAKGALEAARAYYRQVAEDGHEHIHVMLAREGEYTPEGRYQTESEARKIDTGLEVLLEALNLPVVKVGQEAVEAFTTAVWRWNRTLNGKVAVASNAKVGNTRAFGFLYEFALDTRSSKKGNECFICNRQADGEVAGVRTFECGHPQGVA